VSSEAAIAGFCGKVPTRADFVARRLPVAWIETWHNWLGEAIAASRAALGEGWLPAYLEGPIWRFAVPAGLIGDLAFAGTLTPSVDRIGRYFPFSVVMLLPSVAALSAFALNADRWFSEAEAVSLAALEEEAELDLDVLGDRIASLHDGASASAGRAAGETRPGTVADPGIVLSLERSTPLADMAPDHLRGGNSVWWTLGSGRVPPVALLARGLPRPVAFAALLTGDWAAHGWRDDGSILGSAQPGPGGGGAVER
jgi:type VI secretion system protein ImpM